MGPIECRCPIRWFCINRQGCDSYVASQQNVSTRIKRPDLGLLKKTGGYIPQYDSNLIDGIFERRYGKNKDNE